MKKTIIVIRRVILTIQEMKVESVEDISGGKT